MMAMSLKERPVAKSSHNQPGQVSRRLLLQCKHVRRRSSKEIHAREGYGKPRQLFLMVVMQRILEWTAGFSHFSKYRPLEESHAQESCRRPQQLSWRVVMQRILERTEGFLHFSKYRPLEESHVQESFRRPQQLS
jgi:hypothetical protein